MRVLLTCIALLLSSTVCAKDVTEIKSNVSSVEVVTTEDTGFGLAPLKSYEKIYSSDVVSIAKQYFNSIDVERSDWRGLNASKELYFGKNKEIVQKISIVVPPLYEMLLFSGSGVSYKTSKLLDKTIDKQCQRYIHHLNEFQDNIVNYMSVVNMTTNKIVAKLKNSKVVIVSFKCELTI